MNNHLKTKHIFRLLIITMVSLCLLPAGSALSQEMQKTSGTHPFFAAVGSSAETFILFSRQQDNTTEYQLAFSDYNSDQFTLSRPFNGSPAAAVFLRHRIFVYLDNGRAYSHSIGDNRTERRLPDNLIPLAAAANEHQPILLVQASQNITLPYFDTTAQTPTINAPYNAKETQTAPSSDEEEKLVPVPNNQLQPTTRQDGIIQISQNDIALITVNDRDQWVSLTLEPIALASVNQVTMAVAENRVHIFSLQPETQDDNSTNQLLYCFLDLLPNAQPNIAAKNDITGLLAIQAFTLNGTLKLAIAVDTSTTNGDQSQTEAANFQICTPTEPDQDWPVSGPLQTTTTEILTAQAQLVRFAQFNNAIAAFSWDGQNKMHFGQYADDGQLIAPLATEVQIAMPNLPAFLELLLSSYTEVVLMIFAGIIIIARSKEIFSETPQLPAHFRLAPLWRRAVAFLLDLFPAIFVGIIFMQFFTSADELQPAIDNMSMVPSPQEFQQFIVQNPKLIALMLITAAISATVWIIYGTICETLMSTTLGKKALGLTVVDTQFRKLNFSKALIRNIFRVIGVFRNLEFLTLILLLFTRRRQRLGDIVARTIVVMKKPQLKIILDGQPENQPPQQDEQKEDDLTH